MQRTNVVQLKPSKKQVKILKELLLLSSCVYNSANFLVRQQFFNREKVSSFFDLQQRLQNIDDYQLLGRSYALPRLQVYAETNNARFKLIKSKNQKWVGLPKYYKNRKTNTTIPSFLVFDGCQYSIKKNHIVIPLSRRMRKKYGFKHFKIRYNGVLNWKGLQKRGQIHFKDGSFYLYQSIELKDKPIKKSKFKAGLDFGIKKLLTVYVNNGNDKVIGSNRFFKQWLYWTNLIAKEQGKLALQNKKTSKNLQRLFKKRKEWQNNLYNNLVARMFRFLRRNNVSYLAIGNLSNIRDDCNFGRKVNQMVHNYWSFDLLFKKIRDKTEEFGIELKQETEEYTSRTCPVCGSDDKNNCKDRIFFCSDCGYIDHRDVVGARNNLFKSLYGSIQSVHWGEASPLEVVE